MKALYQKGCAVLQVRERWEEKQSTFYQMQYDGIRRRRKPYPGAPDLHFPLVDTAITKLEPFFYNQVFSSDRLANFHAAKPELEEAADAAAQYLDDHLTQETVFEDEILMAISAMLLTGRGVLKQWWNPRERRVEFESVHPIELIVPPQTKRLEDADWVIHIKRMTQEAYERDPRYAQNSDLLKRIKGGEPDDGSNGDYEQDRMEREGITYAKNENEILFWEFYQRKRAGGWTVHTFSPKAPEEPLRPPFALPWQWQGKHFHPFDSFVMEKKNGDWFTPRGVAELLAPFESSATKHWNAKHEYMDFHCRPLFTRHPEATLGNNANPRFEPGSMLPPGVQPARPERPPIAFDEEMRNHRDIAEQRLMMPDFGVGGQDGQDNKTATEVNYIRSLSTAGVDQRSRLFRKALASVFRKSWALLVLYNLPAVTKWAAENRKVLPPQALLDSFRIEPDGSSDLWNKQQRMQRAIARFQLFNGDPLVNQEFLRKDIFAADDARLVKTHLMPNGLAAADEQEDEAHEVMLLLEGFPVHAKPHENHAARIQVLFGKLTQAVSEGRALEDRQRQMIEGHMGEHLNMLRQQNPDVFRQVMAKIQGPRQPQAMQGPQPMEAMA